MHAPCSHACDSADGLKICIKADAPCWQVNLKESTSATLPFENAKQVQHVILHRHVFCVGLATGWRQCHVHCNVMQIRTLCVSPSGQLLLSIDEDGRSLLINRERHALLHHFSFKKPVAAAAFSRDGRYIACAVGRLLQVSG